MKKLLALVVVVLFFCNTGITLASTSTFSFEAGGGYSRLLSESWGAVAGKIGGSYHLSNGFAIDLGVHGLYYKVKDNVLDVEPTFIVITPAAALRYDLGPAYLFAGPGYEITRMSNLWGQTSTSKQWVAVAGLGHVFEKLLLGLDWFVDITFESTFKIKEPKVGALLGLRF